MAATASSLNSLSAPEPSATPRRPAALPLLRQLLLGLAIFAGVLAASVPFALISEGLALGAAVAVAGVLVVLLARRLMIALLMATLLAALGAFAAAHSVHLALQAPPFGFTELSPATGPVTGTAPLAPPPAILVLPARAELGGRHITIAGWVFPAALFALWAVGFAAIRANRAGLRWLWRRLERTSARA